MHLAVVINLCHANGADLVMTIMDMERVVHVECVWEAKVSGRVEVHSLLFYYNFLFLFHQFSSFGKELFSFVDSSII